MTYSIIGILAAIVLLIINRDVLHPYNNKEITPAERNYRRFLMGVMAYYVTDFLWGFLEAARLTKILYADTAVHFLAMATAVMLWTRYVVSYLDEDNAFGRFLTKAGMLFLAFEIAVVAVNFFRPVLFWFDAEGAYYAGPARYVTLAFQILLFFLSSVYTLWITSKTEGKTRRRHLTIGVFGIAMMLLISIQVFYPLLPLYAMGYMLGTCLLHTFVVEDEKEEYRRELKDTLAIAESASKAKTAFLSNMSHEIRTPMNAIIGLNNIAMNDPSASDKVKEYLEKIGASAHHLLGIINEILDMSRIESGRMTIEQEEFSFAKCLEQVNTMISGQCRDKGLAYNCNILGRVDDYYVGDAMKLKQVMINILGNSVKFTPAGGEVNLQIEEGARYDNKAVLKFTFRDTGIGMSAEYLPHLFEAFSQEDSSTTSRYGSTGLGMPITKSIVELMNGNIEVESEKGRGTTFTVTVTMMTSEHEGGKELGTISPDELCVLVIDDDPIACEHAQVVLGQVGVSCEKAMSGAEGLEMAKLRHARREPYNLILLDWQMPEMDGVETARRIREIISHESAIIILTAYRWDDVLEEALQAGVDSFIPKPLFVATVLDEFKSAMKRKGITAGRKQEKAELRGRRILLAEDVQINAEIMSMVLQAREMEADLAENGKIAVEKYESHEPGYYDAILMDMRMPEMDGLEATRRIRAADRTDAQIIPIIALTANAFDEDVQRSLQAGLNAHLSKPVEPENLYSTLESLIKA